LEELDISEVTIKKKKEGGHSHSHKEGGHNHKDKKKKAKKDMNVHAVFLHFLGDAISSVMVLIAGALIHFFHGTWILYIDPVSR
jgi:zinc transporter 1